MNFRTNGGLHFRRDTSPNETLRLWQALNAPASRAVISHGGTILHQHSVGVDHALYYLALEKSPVGMRAADSLRGMFDPGGIMNPGKLLEKCTHMVLHIKILSIQYPERYVVRRLVTAAHEELSAECPDVKMEITEISDAALICQYAQVILQPTLVINEKVVCSGLFPTKGEIIQWMREAR